MDYLGKHAFFSFKNYIFKRKHDSNNIKMFTENIIKLYSACTQELPSIFCDGIVTTIVTML